MDTCQKPLVLLRFVAGGYVFTRAFPASLDAIHARISSLVRNTLDFSNRKDAQRKTQNRSIKQAGENIRKSSPLQCQSFSCFPSLQRLICETTSVQNKYPRECSPPRVNCTLFTSDGVYFASGSTYNNNNNKTYL